MKPVFQTLFGDKVGNCYAACLASLLEIPIGEVPNFCALPADAWTAARDAWLEDRGLFCVCVLLPEKQPVIYPIPSAYCILSGPSPRGGCLHSVVGQTLGRGGFQIAHDPHPGGEGLAGRVEDVTFLAALEPQRVRKASDIPDPLVHWWPPAFPQIACGAPDEAAWTVHRHEVITCPECRRILTQETERRVA